MNFTTRPLYGGAITVDLPDDYLDASDLRAVPDHQEIFLARLGLTSIIFDLNQRAEPPEHPCTTDKEAMHYHYRDITETGHGRTDDRGASLELEEESNIYRLGQATIDHLTTAPTYTLFATQTPKDPTPASVLSGQISSDAMRHKKADFTGLFLTMVRLEAQKTDILITVNVPHVSGEYNESDVDLYDGHMGPLIEAARQIHERILQSFRINDWSLFGDDE